MIKTPLVLLLFIGQGVFAQRPAEGFTISLPTEKVAHSLYNQIAFIDSRHDTTNMGNVPAGRVKTKEQENRSPEWRVYQDQGKRDVLGNYSWRKQSYIAQFNVKKKQLKPFWSLNCLYTVFVRNHS